MLNRKEIEEKVIEIVTETLALESPAKLEDSFQEDLGADSIDMVTLLVSLESEVPGQIDDSALDDKKTLKDFVDFIEEIILNETVPA
ncbi:MAG TPA: acyl carrier protein [Chromatiales bacterium]|nr:acyl carrier protein [Thiotrichales bacterium]HIP67983.1 acyl carrier protein [Chromatiales bacterium]